MPSYFKKNQLSTDFNSSTKENLDEIGHNVEEIDKIENEITKSLSSKKLSVDYSKFENHIFYGSAYWAINFTLSRIFDEDNGYPIFGELKEKNKWRNDNTDFENWFFDNEWPHQNGFLYLTGSTFGTFIDFKRDFQLSTGSSLTIEFLLHPNHQQIQNSSSTIGSTIIHYGDNDFGGYSVNFDPSHQNLQFSLFSASVSQSLSVNLTSSLSQSSHISFVYDSGSQKQIAYVNGEFRSSRSISTFIPFIRPSGNSFSGTLYLGVYDTGSIGGVTGSYSGSINDLRIWKSARTATEIKRTYFTNTHANSSASLVGYYKFNELYDVSPSNIIIDYSGKDNHISLFGSNVSISKTSGSLASFFKSKGDPIFNRANSRVSSSLSTWFTSGSNFDRENRNFIFKLIPSFFIEEEEHDEMRLFLLLLARHWDRLRLYIEHLGYVLYSDETNYNVAPDETLNLLASTYGIDITDVYEAKDALQYYFGENVLSSGSLDNSLQKIRNQLRRNLVNNIHYIFKTKATKEAILASLRSLGLDDSIVNINEYSIFSGGIETTYYPKTVERRVLRLDSFNSGTYVEFHSSSWAKDNDVSIQLRFLLNSASTETTHSLWSIQGSPYFYGEMVAEKQNPTSSLGLVKFYWNGLGISSGNPVSTSLERIFDNEWVNLTLFKPSSLDTFKSGNLHISRLFRDEIDFSQSVKFAFGGAIDLDPTTINFIGALGSGSTGFDGHIQEYRVWYVPISSSTLLDRHTKDFDSLSVPDFKNDINDLKVHFKLNDFTASSSPVEIHNYAPNNTIYSGSLISGSLTESINFPGKHIYKLEPSYIYDLGINNDKIRIKNSSKFTNSDINEDIPYMSIDISPISSLNKEIIKSFGDLEKFNDIIGHPYHRYQDINTDLRSYRSKFFDSKIAGKIKYKSFLSILKWLDMNFGSYFEQLVPLDLGSSISSFVVEPHILEQSTFTYPFPFRQGKRSKDIEGTITNISSVTASSGLSFGVERLTADPGRYGAATSASAELTPDVNFLEYTGSGINYQNRLQRKIATDTLSGNLNRLAPTGYGNGFYTTVITGANYLKNVLNVIEGTTIGTLTQSINDTDDYSRFLPSDVHFTGTINAVLDQGWLYQARVGTTIQERTGSQIDTGIGYGGGWGQLWYVSNKANVGFGRQNPDGFDFTLTKSLDVKLSPNGEPVEIKKEAENSKTFTFWPAKRYFNGVIIRYLDNPESLPDVQSNVFAIFNEARMINFFKDQGVGNQCIGLGEEIDIKNFKSLNINIKNKIIENEPNTQWKIGYQFRFQFYNDASVVGSYETSLSGSTFEISGAREFRGLESRVNIQKFIDPLVDVPGRGFNIQYSRNIPSANKMKIFLELQKISSSHSPTGTKTLKVFSLPEITIFKDPLPDVTFGNINNA